MITTDSTAIGAPKAAPSLALSWEEEEEPEGIKVADDDADDAAEVD